MPAFPGAEGYGSTTPGGRGGRIIRVTNLNDSGAGSLRAALDELPAYPGEPRIIIFDVCGTINGKYSSTLNIKYPFCTIAGQTAPGDGICLKGAEISVGTHDVVIRGLRVRPGDEGKPTGNNYDGPDGIKISNYLGLGDIYNVIIDHCSVSWATDENGSVWENTNKNGKIFDVTFQWNVISEALHCAGIHIENGTVQCHSMGLLIGDRVQNVSVHHNLLAHNSSRNALIQSGTKTEFINNVIYNWKDGSTSVSNSNGISLPSLADLIGNYYMTGPNYKHHTNPNPSMNSYWEINIGGTLNADSRIFIAGNIGPNRSDNTKSEWSLVKGDSERFKSNVRVAANTSTPVVNESAGSAFKKVLKNAGATAPQRDATDARVVSTVKDLTGMVPDRMSGIGGYPAYTSSCVAPTDTDGDGMPDYFEDVNGLNKQVRDGNLTELSLKFTGREGYTNMEVYLNNLMDKMDLKR